MNAKKLLRLKTSKWQRFSKKIGRDMAKSLMPAGRPAHLARILP
jgi:hypothetical protein